MIRILCFLLLLLLPYASFAQGDMRVYTVAGSMTATDLGDGGPATAAAMLNTEGIWMDGNCNLYISDMVPNRRIRKVDIKTGIITTIAGNGTSGANGDNGPATNAELSSPYGLYADVAGNVFFADGDNYKVRRIDVMTGVITTFAGGGAALGDGGLATNAKIG